MAKECPKCRRKLGFFEKLVKCQKCGQVFCEKCLKGLIVGKCPYCGGKDLAPV